MLFPTRKRAASGSGTITTAAAVCESVYVVLPSSVVHMGMADGDGEGENTEGVIRRRWRMCILVLVQDCKSVVDTQIVDDLQY